MKRNIYHVVHNNQTEKWDIKQAGLNYNINSFELKKDAEKIAVSMAKIVQPSQVKIHRLNGKIQKEWTYGNDPEKYLG